MKPTKENNIQANNSGQVDINFYVRKAHKLRSEAFAVRFSKRKKKAANSANPKPTMPRVA